MKKQTNSTMKAHIIRRAPYLLLLVAGTVTAFSPTPTPTPPPIVLQGQGEKIHGLNTSLLTWSGANSSSVDVYRDGAVIATTANDGSYVDHTGDGNQVEYTYNVCEAATQTCSNQVVLSFDQTIDATWSANPVSGDWNNPLNWTPNIVPNGPFARATFNISSITDISLSGAVEVDNIRFRAAASAFTITVPAKKTLTLSGAGVINNSGQEQNFALTGGTMTFQGTSTAGRNSVYSCDGTINFYDSSKAGESMFVFTGGTQRGHGGAGADFRDSSSAANATLIVEAGTVAGAYGGSVSFFDGEGVSAGNATIIANGATVAGALGGQVDFFGILPSEPTLIGNGGINGGTGAVFQFFTDIPGNLAHFQLYGDALLDISIAGDVTIGSLAGDGVVDLGDFTLTVGGNGQDTLFSGLLDQINTEGGNAGLRKVGSGTLALSHDNMFKGGITVAGGALVMENQTGSASGSDGVAVEEGTLGGGGITAGAVDIGTGGGPGAFLAPGQRAGAGETLTIEGALTFKADGTYTWRVNTKKATADQVIVNGVTIDNGSQFLFAAVGNSKLAAGTEFTAISDISADPISGTFSNLPDGGTITVGNNTFQVSYEGGDGNDLTLTVLP
jgi:autotransporter-associated beta strand protein